MARFFKARDPSIACHAVEPQGAAVLAGGPSTEAGHRIQGGGFSMPSLPLLVPSLVDGFTEIRDTDAIDGARRLARLEWIFAGFSAGACVSAAECLLAGPQEGKSVGHRAGGLGHEIPEHRPVDG